MSSVELPKYLRSRLHSLKISNTEAARRADISRQTWYRLLNDEVEETKLSTLIRVAEALQTNPMIILRIYFQNRKSQEQPGSVPAPQYASGLVTDLTMPEGSEVQVSSTFEKTWEIANLGSSAWDGLQLQCTDGQLQTPAGREAVASHQPVPVQYALTANIRNLAIPYTAPGEHTQLTVSLQAPAEAGPTVSNWQIVDSAGRHLTPTLETLVCSVEVV